MINHLALLQRPRGLCSTQASRVLPSDPGVPRFAWQPAENRLRRLLKAARTARVAPPTIRPAGRAHACHVTRRDPAAVHSMSPPTRPMTTAWPRPSPATLADLDALPDDVIGEIIDGVLY